MITYFDSSSLPSVSFPSLDPTVPLPLSYSYISREKTWWGGIIDVKLFRNKLEGSPSNFMSSIVSLSTKDLRPIDKAYLKKMRWLKA